MTDTDSNRYFENLLARCDRRNTAAATKDIECPHPTEAVMESPQTLGNKEARANLGPQLLMTQRVALGPVA